jgi:PAS domain S-box-containing protein
LIEEQTADLIADLTSTSERWEAADRLARHVGAEHLIIFIPDPELGQHLPAPGFPQTLPRGKLWRDFITSCLTSSVHTGELFFLSADRPCTAFGIATADSSVLILLGGKPDSVRANAVCHLLPVLAAAFRQEMNAQIAAAQSALAREAARQASALAGALDNVRREVQQATFDRDLALRAAQMGTWRWDAQTNQAVWSNLQEQLFGLSPGTYDGTEEMFLSLVHPEDRPKVQQAVSEELQKHAGYRMTYRVVWPDGQVRWLSAHGHAIADDGGVSGLAGVTWDITEHKQAEDTLVHQAEELARSNADLQQFAYITSHDLQEPIRTIVSYGQLLARRYKAKLDPDADKFLSYIVESGQRMADLVRDLLSFSRASNVQDIPLAAVPLEQALKWAVMNLQESIAATDAKVSHDPLPTVVGNAVQLVQLFQNLLSNAIKYRGDRRPEIHVTAAEADETCWRVSVRDNGIGINPIYRDRIFELFKRLHGREIPGTGVGLAICKKIVENHSGRIWVEPAEGGGSTFVFTIARGESR